MVENEGKTIDEETCKICDHVIKVCDRLGNRAICEKTIQDLKDNKIAIEEVMITLTKHFDQEKFFKTWDELAEEKP